MIARRRSADIALSSNLAREACHRTGNWFSSVVLDMSGRMKCLRMRDTLVDLAENDYAREPGFGVAWDCGVEDINACVLLDLDMVWQ
jgi:hypothetical protein